MKKFDGVVCNQTEPIAKGLSSIVYRVERDGLPRVIRILSIPNEAMKKKVDQEIELFQTFLGHRNIIRFIEHKESDGYMYELMEHGVLGNLEQYQKDHPNYFKDHKRLTSFFRKIVKGVEFIHSKGYIHSDLKPQNIVLAANLEPKIIDFTSSIPKGQVSNYRGTLGYADPSFLIARSPLVELEFDEYNDVYSLGVILYELTHGSGHLPFDGEYEADIIVALTRHRFKIAKGTHIHLARIIHSCLVISKKWRLSIDELLKELDAADRIPENDVLTEDVYLRNDEGIPSWMKPIKRKKFTRKTLYTYVLIVILLLLIVSMVGYIWRLSKARTASENMEVKTALEGN